MSQTILRGDLHCHEIGTAAPQLVAIFCHGFGAPGSDLAPLADELMALEPGLESGVRFVFPEAPLSLDDEGMYGGRAWWPIDMLKLQRAVQLGEFRNLRDDQPPLLAAARAKLLKLIAVLQAETGLPLSRFVLGGFSQGSMLATDVALRLPDSPAALIIWSGTLLNESEWREHAASRAGLKVLQSHGRQDMLLPFEAAGWLRDLLTAAGLEVDFLPFPGGHTIPYPALQRTAKLLREALVENIA
jgi:phospholipase/carboxylesterase